MAKKKQVGEKFRMVFVTHSMTRIFRYLLFAAVVIVLIWWAAPYTSGFFRPPYDIYLVWLVVLILIIMVLSLYFRKRGFAQAKEKHLLLKVPLFRARIPYKLVESVRMVLFADLYQKKTMSWAQRRFLVRYLPKTVVAVNLKKYPVGITLLRLFLPGYLFLPKTKGKGFVVYTQDFMAFSTALDSRMNAARAAEATEGTQEAGRP